MIVVDLLFCYCKPYCLIWLGSDDSSSDDGATLGRIRTPRNRRLNINEGPEAVSNMKPHGKWTLACNPRYLMLMQLNL